MLFTMLVAIAFNLTFGSIRDGAVDTTLRDTFSVRPLGSKVIVSMLALIVVFKNMRHVTTVDDIVIPIVTINCVTLTLFIMLTGVSHVPTIIRRVINGTFN